MFVNVAFHSLNHKNAMYFYFVDKFLLNLGLKF